MSGWVIATLILVAALLLFGVVLAVLLAETNTQSQTDETERKEIE